MNNKVYVITRGSYSDYHICAVTLDPERAKNLKRLFSGYDEANIEEYPLDEKVETRVYGVTLQRESGKHIKTKLDDYGFYDDGGVEEDCEFGADEKLTFWCDAKDEEHALKIARDRLAQYKAEREGIS